MGVRVHDHAYDEVSPQVHDAALSSAQELQIARQRPNPFLRPVEAQAVDRLVRERAQRKFGEIVLKAVEPPGELRERYQNGAARQWLRARQQYGQRFGRGLQNWYRTVCAGPDSEPVAVGQEVSSKVRLRGADTDAQGRNCVRNQPERQGWIHNNGDARADDVHSEAIPAAG